MDAPWYKHAVIYQVHVRAFLDSTSDGVGDFAGLTSKLGYIEELGVDKERFPTAAIVALVTTFNQGVMLEHLSGVTTGHDELLAMIDGWLTEREDAASPE